MKRIISIFMLMAILLSAFSLNVFAEDNAQSGIGDTHGPASGSAWYNTNQYLWKVTLYVGKSDQKTKQSSLINDFYKLGTVIIKNSSWTLPKNTSFGSGTKAEYLNGSKFQQATSCVLLEVNNCPAIPIVSDGNIQTVKKYFGSVGTVKTILKTICKKQNKTETDLLMSKTFTIGGNTKSGWDYTYLEPNATSNRVPWVIVYEPLVVLNLKDKVTKLAFSATEFALCELNGWYDWNSGGGKGENCPSLPEKHLPSSVQLEESWFGYPVFPVTEGKWDYNDVVKGGGWGMRWLPPAIVESCEVEDFSVTELSATPEKLLQGEDCVIAYTLDNWNEEKAYTNIPIQILMNDKVVKIENVDFLPYGRRWHTFTIPVEMTGKITIDVRINWNDKNKETDANNNILSTTIEVAPCYEFSVDYLNVTPTSCKENDTVTVTFRTDSWDKFNAYTDIPVELLYNGKVVHSEYVDYDAYGAKEHTIKLNVGNTVGTNTLEARINWKNKNKEANPSNNTTEKMVLTVESNIDLSIESIDPNINYREGIEVVTSYRMYNNSSQNIVPQNKNTVKFESYYYNGSKKVIVNTQYWRQAVIPANGNNLVYFKWRVPTGIIGKTIYCKATINSENTIKETRTNNNSDTLAKVVYDLKKSQTPNTKYEEKTPDDFAKSKVPCTTTESASWSMWEYINGAFQKKYYGVTFSNATPIIVPDEGSPSAVYKNGKWYMKSGYGFTLNYLPVITKINGTLMPSASAYTSVQNCFATFPEFKYSKSNNEFRTLKLANGKWQFEPNKYADGNERYHFTPLWYPNGSYTVQTTATEVWTPAGMISCITNSNDIEIVDSAYDDWYIGR